MESRVKIMGVPVDDVNMEEAVDKIEGLIRAKRPSYVVTPNVDHLMRLQHDADFRRIYENSSCSLADGMPILWAGKTLGTPLKAKVSGSDLFPNLCKRAAEMGHGLFFLGGREGAARRAASVMLSRYPGLRVVGTYCPAMGFERDDAENAKIVELIRRSGADVVFVGLGSPKQEKWIDRFHSEYGASVSIGVGVTFEFVSGMVQRAPAWMQKTGLEWLWRLLMEPKRLWKRYLVDDMAFFGLLLREKIAPRKR